MIVEGLLWFDDDPRRPFSAKMAEAAQRFSERTGWIPTACEAHPQMLAQRGAVAASPRTGGHGRRATAIPEESTNAPRLAVTPNPSLRPNYILVGVEAGKTPRHVRREKPGRAKEPVASAKPARTPAPRRPPADTPRLSA
jgi:hypothetical protein